jgi:hypothetical protein
LLALAVITRSRSDTALTNAGKAARTLARIFIDFREVEIEAVPMPNDVSETLQFDEQSVEFGIEQSRALAVDRRRHLIQQILMCRLAGWNISVDIVGEAQHHLFDAVVDVVDAERQAEPRAHSLME